MNGAKEMKKLILGATIGNCVHVAGVLHFLALAEEEGYFTNFLGSAIPIRLLFSKIVQFKPDVVAIGYRLTPENVVPLLKEINNKRQLLTKQPKWCFGGTKPVADIARDFNFFSFISDGYDDINDAIHYLRGRKHFLDDKNYKNNVIERVEANYPYPILRHHYGRPSLNETISGIKSISESKVLDVISLGPDQNAQQFFFKSQEMKEEYDGAGGVPIRTPDDLRRLKAASKCGNYPLMRCYSGTENVFQYAKLLKETIDNAWAAIPLFWYNELDGRGSRTIETSLKEAQKLIHWHALNDIPVELNEPHHWGLRDSHDVIPVAMSYISALNAKKFGVKYYIAQYMFNNPSHLSFSMDLAKILAMMEITEDLADEDFLIYRQTRTGLPLLHADSSIAKGQLAASTFMQMVLKPHIIHVVGFCEADHAATAEDVIESCNIVKGVIRQTLRDNFSIDKDKQILFRKNQLISEAKVLLSFIENVYRQYDSPLTNAEVLADCVKKGYLDAVHIPKNDKFLGRLYTKIIDGMCVACDKQTGKPISEYERLQRIFDLQFKSNSKIGGLTHG